MDTYLVLLYGAMAALVALLLSTVLTRGIRAAFARRTGQAGPHLGGIAVVVATLLVATLLVDLSGQSVFGSGSGAGSGSGSWAGAGSGIEGLLWASGGVALLGLVHEVWPLGARLRLAGQAVAAFVVVYGSGLSFFAGVLAVAWIVFVTDAFGRLDRSGGAMGPVGLVTAVGLVLCAGAEGRASLALLLVILAMAFAGFLLRNWHPARILLGHCGSLFGGFLLGSAAVLVHTGHEALPSAVGLSALMVVVLMDTALVLLSRRRAGRPLFVEGPDHIAHRLRRVGFTVPGTVVVLGTLAVAGALTGSLVQRALFGPMAALPLLVVVVLALYKLLKVRVYRPRGGPLPARPAPGRGTATGAGAGTGSGAKVPGPATVRRRRVPAPTGRTPVSTGRTPVPTGRTPVPTGRNWRGLATRTRTVIAARRAHATAPHATGSGGHVSATTAPVTPASPPRGPATGRTPVDADLARG